MCHRFKIVFLLSLIFIANIEANECLTCHPKNMQSCSNSIHYTHKNEIDTIRKVFGIKNSDVTLQTLPESKNNIEKPQDLVDDMLRRKCLSCHLQNSTINPSQNSCLACHETHTNKDDAHKAKPNQNKCLKCHTYEYTGLEYLGLFPHDYDKSYRSPLTKEGYYPAKLSGIDYHHLQSDIHFQSGMNCISCHNKKDKTSWEEKPTCSSCHTTLSKTNHKTYHQNLDCSSCHSSWNISSYELNLLRDDSKNYEQWKRLHTQEDEELERFLDEAQKSSIKPKPKMRDYLSGELKEGIWYMGWKFRRWENFFLINDKFGKIKIAKPMFQYRISYKNKDGKTILDDISSVDGEKMEAFVPSTPHTINKKSKSCEMCHNNKIMFDNTLINKNLFQGTILKGSPLTKKQLQNMQSDFYKSERAKTFFK